MSSSLFNEKKNTTLMHVVLAVIILLVCFWGYPKAIGELFPNGAFSAVLVVLSVAYVASAVWSVMVSENPNGWDKKSLAISVACGILLLLWVCFWCSVHVWSK